MPLGNKQVEQVARLARLQLTPLEISKFTGELTLIVAYFEQLQALDTAAVDLSALSGETPNVCRDDVVTASLPRTLALANAPRTDGEYFLVPKVIG